MLELLKYEYISAKMLPHATSQIKINISKYIITYPKSILANLKQTEYHFSWIYILKNIFKITSAIISW